VIVLTPLRSGGTGADITWVRGGYEIDANAPETRQMPEARDQPLGGSLTPIEAVIEVAKSDCPTEWARFCNLADQRVQRERPMEISQEEAARQLLLAAGELPAQRLASLDAQISGYRQLAGFERPPKTELEVAVAEAETIENLFRNRLLAALQSGRYFLKAFDRLELHTVSPGLIKPEHFRFDSDTMEVNGIKLTGVHFVRAQAVPAAQNHAPGRRPGQNSPKDRACDIVLSILNDQARRPPKRRGRKTELARMVGAALSNEGKSYAVNSIEKFIRGTVQDWERLNPDR
jgi:hypothetical protein